MNRLDLPNQLNVALTIKEYFNRNCKILEINYVECEHIALIKDIYHISGKVSYYAVVWHDDGYALCHYSQKFDALIGAMVVYKKLKDALDSGMIKKYWKAKLSVSKERN